MQEAPASGAPPWVARTEIVTTACSEIGLTGDALAASSNAPPEDAAGAGAWGFGAAATTGGAAGACGFGAAAGGLLGGGGIGSNVGVPAGCCEGVSSRGCASAAGWGGAASAGAVSAGAASAEAGCAAGAA